MEKSVVRAVVVTKSVTRMVMKLQAIGGGGGGEREAGGDLYGEQVCGAGAQVGGALFHVLKIVVNAVNEWWRRDSRVR